MHFVNALAYLLSLGHETLTIKLGLKNTETLLAALDYPQKAFPSVQIAGTNGKGSTAVMLDSICRAAGIRTGLFTSPHLISITERISSDGQQISEADFASFTALVKSTGRELRHPGLLKYPPTFFEHTTAIAFLAFREAKVELAILETGLGGRLDSTTAAAAEIIAITPVAMDHEEYLGHTIAEIAAEKAAIIRPGVTAVIAPQVDEVRNVILSRCEFVGVKPQFVDLSRVLEMKIGLRGRHQSVNAATAIAVADVLCERGFEISPDAVIEGLATARHPGRLEFWEGPPRILFDGAHNPAAARALRDYLDEFVHEPITMIFGAMRDKNLKDMASILFPGADKLILTEIDNPRAATLDSLKSVARGRIDDERVYETSSPNEALRIANEISASDDLICVTGSLYLVGAVRNIATTCQKPDREGGPGSVASPCLRAGC